MAILGVDDFKSKLVGGGARANLFKVTLNYPSYVNGDVELTSFTDETTALAIPIDLASTPIFKNSLEYLEEF